MNIQVPNLVTSLDGPLMQLEKLFFDNQVDIEAWFREQWQATPPPIYSSVDLRNAGFKLAPIDTNLFPAGFNNLSPELMSLAIQAAQATMAEICSTAKNLLIIPENHTRNTFYFESLAMLVDIFQGAGFSVCIGSLNPEITQATTYDLPSGKQICLQPLVRDGEQVGVEGFSSCCIILNNDLSDGIPDILKGIKQRVMPSEQLGWSKRLKSQHFHFYEKVAQELADLIGMDPWLMNPYFDQCPEVDFMRQDGQQCLMSRAEALLKKIRKKYDEYSIKEKPFLVIKADQGTYGMAVMMIHDPQELLELNRKQRTRMSKLKGGAMVTKAIIQEGVYSFETWGNDNSVAEPVVYMLGRYVIGGFYRVHEDRGPDENLNAPGMNFQSLAFAKPCHSPGSDANKPRNRFYAYGVVARLAMLAAAREIASFQEK